MLSLTVLILAYNEEANIGRTLGALKFAPEVVILDSGSTDRTIEIAKSSHQNVRVVHRAFDSHPNQWNFGLDQVTTEWVLTLDADYEVSPQLAAEIGALGLDSKEIGYWAEFEYRIYGHPLRGSSYPARIVLFKRSQARYVDDGHTQTLWLKDMDGALRAPPKTETLTAEKLKLEGQRIGKLSGKIYHDDRKPLSRWIQEQDRYARLEAEHLLGKPLDRLSSQDRLRRRVFFAAPAMFLYLLVGRGLILDGWPGWLYVAQRTIAELLLSMRLLIEKHQIEAK